MSHSGSFPQQAGTLGYLLRSPYRALSKRLYARLSQRGFADIRPSHASVFRHIGPEGNRLTELAEQADMTKQSMAYLVDALKEAGYLSLRPDPIDGRAKLVSLTPRGVKLLRSLLEISAELETEVANKLGAPFVKRLRESLLQLDQALEGE